MGRIERSKNLKIAFIVFGEMGHFIPLARLANALEERGHSTVFLSASYGREKALKMMDQNGIKGKLITPDSFTRCMFMYQKPKEEVGPSEMPLNTMMNNEKFINLFVDELKKEQPDLVVSDFYSTFGQDAGDRCGLPVVVHGMLPLDISLFGRGVVWPGKSCTMACCGCFCVCKNMLWCLLDAGNVAYSGSNKDIWRRNRIQAYQRNRIYVSATFFGLEEPTLLPPNVHLTGPNIQPSTADNMAILK